MKFFFLLSIIYIYAFHAQALAAYILSLDRMDLTTTQLANIIDGLDDQKLTKVTGLELSDNMLTGLPDNIIKFTNLKTIELNRNKFTTFPKELTNFSDLKEIELEANQISTLPENLVLPAGMRTLILKSNQITHLPERWDLPKLDYLDLSNNRLKTIPPELAALPKIKYLYLSNNELTTLPPELKAITSKIKELTIDHNQFTNLPEEIRALLAKTGLAAEYQELLPPVPDCDNNFKYNVDVYLDFMGLDIEKKEDQFCAKEIIKRRNSKLKSRMGVVYIPIKSVSDLTDPNSAANLTMKKIHLTNCSRIVISGHGEAGTDHISSDSKAKNGETDYQLHLISDFISRNYHQSDYSEERVLEILMSTCSSALDKIYKFQNIIYYQHKSSTAYRLLSLLERKEINTKVTGYTGTIYSLKNKTYVQEPYADSESKNTQSTISKKIEFSNQGICLAGDRSYLTDSRAGEEKDLEAQAALLSTILKIVDEFYLEQQRLAKDEQTKADVASSHEIYRQKIINVAQTPTNFK